MLPLLLVETLRAYSAAYATSVANTTMQITVQMRWTSEHVNTPRTSEQLLGILPSTPIQKRAAGLLEYQIECFYSII